MLEHGPSARIEALDAARAFVLLLGIVYHACGSFLPGYQAAAVADVSTSGFLEKFVFVSHSFRLEVFFLLAGFFSCTAVGRKGAWSFARTRVWRICLPFVVGWIVLHPWLASGRIMGEAAMRGDYDFWDGIRAGYRYVVEHPIGIYRRSHLWFLYYLGMVTAGVLIVRAVVGSFPERAGAMLTHADRLIGSIMRARWSVPALAVPTAGVILMMRRWGVDTPNLWLRPYLPALTLYGGFFLMGWLLGRQKDLIDEIARRISRLAVTAIVGGAGAFALLGGQHLAESVHRTYVHVVFAVAYATMMWSMVLLTVVVCVRLLPCREAKDGSSRGDARQSRPRAVVRYISDASYWLYLSHLPVVVWLQVAFARLPLHWSVKLPVIVAITLVVLGLIYDLLVRPGVIGQALNGRRSPSASLALCARIRQTAPAWGVSSISEESGFSGRSRR